MENLEIEVSKELKENEMTEFVEGNKNITDEKIEKSLNYNSLSDE